MTKTDIDASPQLYARAAGVLFLVSILAGGFGELYAPSTLIASNDAAATATNIRASDMLFRTGFASYLVEALCDVALTLVLYVILKPVHRNLALLAAFFRLVGTATFATAQFFYFASSVTLGGADYLETFSPGQLDTLALLLLEFYGLGGGIFMIFHGAASILLGYLIFRSGYLPRVLGALLALGGLGFVIRNFVLVLAPANASDLLLLPMFLAVISLTPWLIVRGVDVAKWKERVAASYSGA